MNSLLSVFRFAKTTISISLKTFIKTDYQINKLSLLQWQICKRFSFRTDKVTFYIRKRQFKLYVNRLGINVDAKFLLLFSEMEKMKEYDEDIIISKNIYQTATF